MSTPPLSTLFPYTTLFRSPMCIPDPSKPGFEVTDLSLPKSVSQAAVESRSAFLNVVDRHYRALDETAQHRSEEHTSELQSRRDLECRLLLEKKKSIKLRQS